MTHVEGSIFINRPVTDVFDFVADATNEPRFNPSMRRAEKITEGPIGVGTRFKAETTSGGRPVEMIIEFTGFERPRWIREIAQMAAMDLEGTLTFEPLSGGTRMRWSWELKPRGALKLITPLVALMGRRSEKRIWSGLKLFLETPTES